jgi:hypothetical protein
VVVSLGYPLQGVSRQLYVTRQEGIELLTPP